MEKSYEKLVQYVKNEILAGRLKPGDKLETERAQAEMLGLGRNSVREGLRILENIGVITSQQGSGNYIAQNFDESLTELLSLMYFLKDIGEKQVTEYRCMIERDAMLLAPARVTQEQKEQLLAHLDLLEKAEYEQERVIHDRSIHHLLVEAGGNDFLITNYRALTNLIDRYIGPMRSRIIEGMKSRHSLEAAHRTIVEGIVENDAEKGLRGLAEHFGYIERYRLL